MFRRNSSLSLPFKVALIGIYLPFFLVQVYLKFTVPASFVSTGFSGNSYITFEKPVSKNAAIKTGTFLEKDRLNTRYEGPSFSFHFSNIVHLAANNYIIIPGENVFNNSATVKQLITDHLLRGPPSLI